VLIRKLSEMGAEISVHDPYVDQWWEFLTQSEPGTADYSKQRFFRNQDQLEHLEVGKDLSVALKGVDCVVLAVRHQQYLTLDADEVVRQIGKPAAIVDCFGILDDRRIERYFELGCEVKGLGRGHIQRIKDKVRRSKTSEK